MKQIIHAAIAIMALIGLAYVAEAQNVLTSKEKRHIAKQVEAASDGQTFEITKAEVRSEAVHTGAVVIEATVYKKGSDIGYDVMFLVGAKNFRPLYDLTKMTKVVVVSDLREDGIFLAEETAGENKIRRKYFRIGEDGKLELLAFMPPAPKSKSAAAPKPISTFTMAEDEKPDSAGVVLFKNKPYSVDFAEMRLIPEKKQ